MGHRHLPLSEESLEVDIGVEKPEHLQGIREVNRHAFGREEEARLVDALRDCG